MVCLAILDFMLITILKKKKYKKIVSPRKNDFQELPSVCQVGVSSRVLENIRVSKSVYQWAKAKVVD